MSATFSRSKQEMGRTEKLYYGGSIVTMLVAVLAYTYPSLHMVRNVYQQQRIKSEARSVMEEQNRLRVKYEMLVSHAEMERLAREMGFTEPDMDKIIYVVKKR